MKRKILIVTSSYDLTVDYIIRKFPSLQFFRLNTDKINSYEIYISNNPFFWEITSRYDSIALSETTAIYYRKPSVPSLKQFLPEYHNLISKELFSFIEGLVETFPGRCFSRPSVLKRADNKVLQLRLAEEVEFSLPKTCITNSSDRMRLFSKNIEKLYIVKPLSVGKVIFKDGIGIIQTNLIDRKNKIEGLEVSPAYFQEYFPKDYELRVTIVDKDIYAVRIDGGDKIDWRKSPEKNKYSKYKLPSDIEKKCFSLLNLLSLGFGAFDFIVNNGKYYFLEVNANGQWGWLEERLGLTISKSIIKYLLGDGYV